MMYKIVDEIECVVGLSLIYIVDVMVVVLKVVGVMCVGLLVMCYMME